MEKSCGIIPVKPHRGSFLFLLIQHQAGHWGFPKGHIEPGETTAQTAAREFTEETGLELDKIFTRRQFVEKYTYPRDGKIYRKQVVYHLGIVQPGRVKIQVKEIKNYAWLTFDQAMERLTFEQIKKILAACRQYFRKQIVSSPLSS